MSGELAQLVERYGGVVRSAPAVREVTLDCAAVVRDFLHRLHAPSRRIYVFLTGAGATALLEEADRQGHLAVAVESLTHGTIACRGPKPAAALRRYGIGTSVCAVSPYTSHELLDAMTSLELNGADVTIVHYGERSGTVADALRHRGCTLHELCIYEWRLPEDLGPLEEMARSIVGRVVDAVVFTSQVQWLHLRRVAASLNLLDDLIRALNDDIIVAAVGPICSAALEEAGVRPRIVPQHPKMAPLVAALARHFSTVGNPRALSERL